MITITDDMLPLFKAAAKDVLCGCVLYRRHHMNGHGESSSLHFSWREPNSAGASIDHDATFEVDHAQVLNYTERDITHAYGRFDSRIVAMLSNILKTGDDIHMEISVTNQYDNVFITVNRTLANGKTKTVYAGYIHAAMSGDCAHFA